MLIQNESHLVLVCKQTAPSLSWNLYGRHSSFSLTACSIAKSWQQARLDYKTYWFPILDHACGCQLSSRRRVMRTEKSCMRFSEEMRRKEARNLFEGCNVRGHRVFVLLERQVGSPEGSFDQSIEGRVLCERGNIWSTWRIVSIRTILPYRDVGMASV